jgi:methionine sulfoxide reductase heme-binding subunit
MSTPSVAKARPARPLSWLQPAIFTGSLLPLIAIGYFAVSGRLGANPVTEALNRLGLLALVLLILSLACTPLKTLFGWTWPIRVRKTLGLFAFFYASLHFLTYAGLDQSLNWRAIFEDITKRKFIFVGFAALVLLIPLAVTSTSGMLKRLGFARWKRLHRLAYVAAGLGIVHFVLRVKKDMTEPLIYGAVLALLLASRLLPDQKAKAAGKGSVPRGGE